MLGTDTLAVEVTHLSSNGIWILIGDDELVLPYEYFPWFRHATVPFLERYVRDVEAGGSNPLTQTIQFEKPVDSRGPFDV